MAAGLQPQSGNSTSGHLNCWWQQSSPIRTHWTMVFQHTEQCIQNLKYYFIIHICMPGFLKLLLSMKLIYMGMWQCVCVCVCMCGFVFVCICVSVSLCRPWKLLITRDQSILLLFLPIFLSGNSFLWPIMLKNLFEVSIFCSKLSCIAIASYGT